MRIEEKVFQILSATPAVIPAARIKVPGNLQNLTRPYIQHFPVSGEGTYSHREMVALKRWRFYQVDVFADDYPSGNAVAESVRLRLGNYRENSVIVFWLPGTWYIGRDPDVQYEHFALHFDIAETL